MKLISQLTGTLSEGALNDPRGAVTALYYQDPQCAGWKISIALTGDGLHFRAMRPGGAEVAIPLDAEVAADPHGAREERAGLGHVDQRHHGRDVRVVQLDDSSIG